MFTFDSIVRYSEIDYREKLNMLGVLNYFQDCSTLQSESLGAGVKALHEKNLVWVISTWQIDVKRYPELGERITIGTFPYKFRGFFGMRNFFIKDEKGEMVAMADTLWTLLNYKEGKPARITEDILAGFDMEDQLPMETVKGKIIMPDEAKALPGIEVKPYHLDANMHVNNGRYVEMITNQIEIRDYKRLRVEYRKQQRLGEILTPYLYEDEKMIYALIKDSEGETATVMEFTK
ncbi:MAG: acyl-[acyl-carrier-protein] thioesterase [Lachnospiraceae bacterium]|nr:acyl-[acyl-carrier-protein] thioesterase [Lachnospiraceae bacterium]